MIDLLLLFLLVGSLAFALVVCLFVVGWVLDQPDHRGRRWFRGD